MMLLPTLLSLMLCACGETSEITSEPESSSEPATQMPITAEKTPLADIQNFRIDRNEEGKWVIHFDSVEHADKYLLKVTCSEETIYENNNITNDTAFDAGSKTGLYSFLLTARNESGAYTDSNANYEINVRIYQDEVIDGVTYTGRVENDIPVGEYHLVYSDNSTFDGTLTNDFKRQKGKHQYTNKMYYEGEFSEDKFEGDGMFTWSTTGNWKDGNTYQGKFKNGVYEEQVGTYYTAANWTRDVAYNGLLNFTGTMGAVFGAPGKAGTTGKGEFSYANNSIYSGDLLKGNGDWDFIRKGWGKNTWTVSEAAGWISGGDSSYTIDNFEGEFDAVSHGWIYGNGIWYFKKDGNPYGYIKGIWDGGNRTGKNTIDLTIQEEYKNALDLTPNE